MGKGKPEQRSRWSWLWKAIGGRNKFSAMFRAVYSLYQIDRIPSKVAVERDRVSLGVTSKWISFSKNINLPVYPRFGQEHRVRLSLPLSWGLMEEPSVTVADVKRRRIAAPSIGHYRIIFSWDRNTSIHPLISWLNNARNEGTGNAMPRVFI